MRIKQVNLINFMNHVDSKIPLSNNLTCVVGPNDSGKSVIIYAIRWFSTNEPRGSQVISTFKGKTAPYCKVELIMEDDTTFIKTRSAKGGTTFECPTWKQTWSKSDIPLEISEVIGIYPYDYGMGTLDLNFSFQLDAPFLLSEAASISANVISHFTGTEVLDKVIKVVDKENWHLNHENNLLEAKIKQDTSFKEKFDFLPESEKQLTHSLQEYLTIKSEYATLLKLQLLLDGYNVTLNKKKGLDAKLNLLKSAADLQKTLKQVEQSDVTLTYLEIMEAKYKIISFNIKGLSEKSKILTEIKGKKERVQELSKAVQQFENFVELFEKYKALTYTLESSKSKLKILKKASNLKTDSINILYNKFKTYNNLYVDYEDLKLKEKNTNNKLTTILSKIDTIKEKQKKVWDNIGNVCPLCNNIIRKGENHERKNKKD